MAVLSDLDDKSRIPADQMAADSIRADMSTALRLAEARGCEVKVYQRGADFLVTTAPDPGLGWSCVYNARPSSDADQKRKAAEEERVILLAQAAREHVSNVQAEMKRYQGALDHIEDVRALRLG